MPLRLALCNPGSGKLLTIAAFLNKIFLQGSHLLIKQIIGLMDQTDKSICRNCWLGMVKPYTVQCSSVPAGLICASIVIFFQACCAYFLCFFIAF